MNTIGQIIRQLRKAKGVTQEELAGALNVTYQAVSKWENGAAQPDIMMMPVLAAYFGVTIDELFGYKLDVMTNKERLICHMERNRILVRGEADLKCGAKTDYYINTENFSTNAQLSRIGEAFADCIRENRMEFDVLVGLAYHGIAFAVAAATALHTKYGKICSYCYDRRVADSRRRMLCGHTLQDGERVVIVDDVMTSGSSVEQRVEQLRRQADIRVAAVIVIVNRRNQMPAGAASGEERIMEKYGAKVYSLITDEDIEAALRNRII